MNYYDNFCRCSDIEEEDMAQLKASTIASEKGWGGRLMNRRRCRVLNIERSLSTDATTAPPTPFVLSEAPHRLPAMLDFDDDELNDETRGKN